MTYETMMLIGTMLAGAASAYCWWRSATASVPAPPQVTGEGAGWGGWPIWAKSDRGDFIDLLATMKLQSRWNRHAAVAACFAALLAIGKEIVAAIGT